MNFGKVKFSAIKLVSFAFLQISTSTCSESFDLGAERPLGVPFSNATASWDAGVGTVFTLKCANCHTSSVNRSRFVPGNTPSTVNGISRESFFDDSTQAGKVYDRMFADSHNPMPPNFATQLTNNEKEKVKSWLETKTIAISSICGTSGSSSLTFNDVAASISADCGSCHNGTDRASLSSLSSAKAYRRTMLSYINDGRMPPSNSAYKSSTAGAAVFNWLCFGVDIQ